MLGYLERTAQPSTHAEKVVADSGIAADERSVHYRPASGTLDGRYPGRNVQRQRRVILQHSAELKPVADMDGAIKNDAVALIVIGPSIVLPDIEIVDR